MSTTPTLQQLQRGLELSTKIAEMEAELAALFSGSATAPKSVKGDARSGKRSPETIAKMKAAQQARWAKVNGKKDKASAAQPPAPKAQTPKASAKKKRSISLQHRAKLSAAAKARWAAKKAE